MAARRFEFEEGGSAKFWEIEVQGASFTVRFGRLGTAGTAKTTTLGSTSEAAAEAEKLIKSKVRKGYQELGADPELSWRPPTHLPTGSHVDKLRSRLVTVFDPSAEAGEEDDDGRKSLPSLRDCQRRAFFVGITYDHDEAEFETRLRALLDDPRAGELQSLLIGGWFTDYCEAPPEEMWALLAERGPKLTALQDLFLGEITQEECEISWIHLGDVGPILSAMPALQHAWVRGHGEELRLSSLRSATLTHLTVQTGGLSNQALQDLLAADLPELRELVLWLGDEQYGNTLDLSLLPTLLARFPKLEHLGLQDAHNQDEVVEAVIGSPVIAQLKGLDFSMGTLSDRGARALLACPHLATLRSLNLRYHFISDDGLLKALRALPCEVNLRDRQEGDEEDGRYPEVAE